MAARTDHLDEAQAQAPHPERDATAAVRPPKPDRSASVAELARRSVAKHPRLLALLAGR